METIKHTPIHILFIEIAPAQADLFNELSQTCPEAYELRQAHGMEDGLQLVHSAKYDVILLNLSVADESAPAAVRELRNLSPHSAVIALTDSEDPAFPEALRSAGAADCLDKALLTNGAALWPLIRQVSNNQALSRKLTEQIQFVASQETLIGEIFAHNSDGMLVLTRDYVIKSLNPAAAEMLEADKDRLIGETFPFEVSTSATSKLELPEEDGSSRLIEISAVELLFKNEESLLVVLRDASQHRAHEIELRRDKERLSVTLELIVDAVIATDNSGVIERMNKEASRLTGVSSEEACGQSLGSILRLKNPKSGKVMTDPLSELLSAEHADIPFKQSLLLERKGDASERSVTAKARPITDDVDGMTHGCITVLRDITAQIKGEADLIQNGRLHSVILLASGIAHDLNNMLATIMGNISIVSMNLAGDEGNAKKLEAAEAAAMQAKSLTLQLLTFSKDGAQSLEVMTVEKLVEDCAQFVLRGSNVKCVTQTDESIWPIVADKVQLGQVVNNLVINADQAMPAGGTIRINIRNRRLRHAEIPTLKAGEYICIEISDDGIGISPEDIDRIFDPYFTTKKEGYGLGLASSHSIIDSHQGAITVESELNVGTCFSVYLPKTQKGLVTPAVSDKKDPKPDSSIHAGRGRILVMDDMEAMMHVAGEILTVLGYEVEFTTNGEEAVEAYKKAKESGNPFDAVVFDLTVPGGMGGEEACNILIEYDPDMIAIASSGYATSNIMSNYQDSAFKGVVPKPYRIKEMSDVLKRVMG